MDAIIESCSETRIKAAVIATRRQIEWNGGYVNNWTTQEFCSYIRSRTPHILLQRDHSGPGQGAFYDDGFESLSHDSKYFDRIHIDPWEKYPEFQEGLDWTIKMIRFCHSLNPELKYEVGTEEAIRYFEAPELEQFLEDLHRQLGDKLFRKIDYAVIQSGTSLKGNIQTGQYDRTRLADMVKVCRKFNVLSKEHNGDYLPVELIREKMRSGLDSINIAPEIGLEETLYYLERIENSSLINEFWVICYKSEKWIKWVDKDFDPFRNKTDLIKISGHYVLSNPVFIEKIKSRIPKADEDIRNRIKSKILSYL